MDENINIWHFVDNPDSVGGESGLPKFLYQFITQNATQLGYELEHLGEGMMIANESVNGWWKTRFLLNSKKKIAFPFIGPGLTLMNVEDKDIDWESIPEESVNLARHRYAHYPTNIRRFHKGRADVEWQLNPDGMYYMDEDGFGMTDDEECTLLAKIDSNGKYVKKILKEIVMRKILWVIGIFIVLGFLYAFLPSSCSSSRARSEDTTTVADEPDEFDDSHYYGDSLTTVNGITYFVNYGDGSDSDVSSYDGTYIVAVRDTVPVDTTYVKGEYSGFVVEGSEIKIISGIDTLTYDITKLPEILDIITPTALPDAVETNFKKTFALNDSSFNCDFTAQFYVMSNEGQWLYDCFNSILRDGIFYMMSDDPSIPVKNYRGDKRNLKAMAGFYQKEFERMYRNDFDEPGDEGVKGPKFDYLFRFMPVWESGDKTLVTYKFYNYQYMGGAHGGMNEYFFTFNRKTGKLLGTNGIFTKDGFTNAIRELEKQLRVYKVNNGYTDQKWPAYVPEGMMEIPYTGSKYDLKESFDGHIYPRPALTKQGIVFSYQPYEMGSFAEGILHFVVPYNKAKIRVQ